MRHSKIEKTKTHERIVAIASKRFREEGLAVFERSEWFNEGGTSGLQRWLSVTWVIRVFLGSGDQCIATAVRGFFRMKTVDRLQESATPDAVSHLCATARLDVLCDTGEGLRRPSRCARWGGGYKQTPFRRYRC